jgi:tRNA A37 methylthiotransferase MiaB
MRDRAGAKATCAEAVRKEAYAVSYSSQDGTAAAKDSAAPLEIAENIVAQCLYELVASLVKTKLDSLYRMADTMKSVLMSRMQEAKFMNLGTTNEVSPTTNGRVTLNE